MNSTPTPSLRRTDELTRTIVLLGGMVFLLTTLAALNGGTAPTSSVWDGLTTTLEGMLSSSWVLALAMIALVAAVWQLTHGRGYGYLAVVLGLMAVALIGPSFVTTIATATRTPDQVKSPDLLDYMGMRTVQGQATSHQLRLDQVSSRWSAGPAAQRSRPLTAASH